MEPMQKSTEIKIFFKGIFKNFLAKSAKSNFRLIFWLGLSLLLVACSNQDVTVGAAVGSVPNATATPILPTPTPFPLATSTPQNTDTPIATVQPPTTLTLVPTNTPVAATPTPSAISTTTTTKTTLTPTPLEAAATTTTTTTALSIYQGQIVFSQAGDIWTMRLGSVAKNRLTTDGGNFSQANFPAGFNRNPIWSPDGKKIAFASARDVYQQPNYRNGYELYVINANGGGLQRISQLADSLNTQRLPLAWVSPDKLLIKVISANSTELALFSISTNSQETLPLPQAQFLAYSPDQKELAYTLLTTTNTDANKQVNDVMLTGPKGGLAINLTNNIVGQNSLITYLAWSPDGKKIAYVENNGDACGYSRLYWLELSGSVSDGVKIVNKTLLATTSSLITNVSWSPDSNRLVYGEVLCSGGAGVQVIGLAGGQPQLLTQGQNPQWNEH